MRGPDILARTMSSSTSRGKSNVKWQYHSRSDTHSKLACWTLLFDLLLECDALREAARSGHVGFGINHVVVGPINKTLDLVLTVVPPGRSGAKRLAFSDLVERWAIELNEEERALLADLPALEHDRPADVSEVAITLEAKACMTEHIKSLPRLHAEILATGYLAKKAVPDCISVSYTLVNAASRFRTPSGTGKVNRHHQPDDAKRVLEMLATAVPTSEQIGGFGYDVIGATVLHCLNDGSPVTVVESGPLATRRADHITYARMVRSICSRYRARFPRYAANSSS